jgi:glucose/mannose transport system substrate-binding protein
MDTACYSLLLALGLAGCNTSEPRELEVFNWWQSLSETTARDALLRMDREPGVKVSSVSNTSRQDGLALPLAKRIFAGTPPAAFQANVGAHLLQWAAIDPELSPGGSREFRAALKRSHITELAPILEGTELLQELPEELTDALCFRAPGEHCGAGDQLFGVPLNVHRANMLYFRQDKLPDFERLGTIETLCPEPAFAAGADPLDGVRIAIDTSLDGFSLETLTFENVLPAVTSGAFYEELFRGLEPRTREGADWTAGVRRALECVQRLASPEFLHESDDRWDSQVLDVHEGEADFTVMGDWASGELQRNRSFDEEGLRALPFPGTESVFVFTADALAAPIGARYPNSVTTFLATAASPAAQEAFSRFKGSLPARVARELQPTGTEAYDNLRTETQRAFLDPAIQKVPALSGLTPPYFPSKALRAALANMVARQTSESVADVIALLQAAQPVLREWQERLAQGPNEPIQ